jgi:ABC-type nitrate/sulfonate/bicarbonate transport system substrate-binding protein
MKRLISTIGLSVLAVLGLFTHSAYALDRYTVMSYTTLSFENMVLQSANHRGAFEKAGIELRVEPTSTMELATQRLDSGALDAHLFPAPGWQARQGSGGKICSTMVMPLVWKFYGALVATVPTWEELRGGTVVTNNAGNFTAQATYKMLAAHGISQESITPRTINSITAARVKAMLSTPGPAVTAAFDPLLEYIGRAKGVYVLEDVASFPVVNSGLMVKCSDMDDPKRRELHRRVVEVLVNEVKWVLDTQQSDPVLIPWLKQTLMDDKYTENYATTYEGLPVKQVDGEPAERMINRTRKFLSLHAPDKELMEDTIKVIFGSVPDGFEKYYDFRWVPK